MRSRQGNLVTITTAIARCFYVATVLANQQTCLPRWRQRECAPIPHHAAVRLKLPGVATLVELADKQRALLAGKRELLR